MVINMLVDETGQKPYQRYLDNHWTEAAQAAFDEPPGVFIEALKQNKGLYVRGPVGTGKTWMLVCIFRYLAETFPMHTTGIVSWLELLKTLKAEFDQPSEAREMEYHYSHLDFLLVDDFGKGNRTPWAMEVMYSLVENRLRLRRTTYFTSNATLKEVETWGPDGEAIASRIRGMCNVLPLLGEDRRVGK